jgi:hypothetical protein
MGVLIRKLLSTKTLFVEGLKLELRGPIHVRRGLLLLTASNVRVLGGHVSEMDETCSLVRQVTRDPFLTSPLGANFDPRGEVVPQG